MSITLCFDFGNTRLKCAVFSDRELQEILVMPNDELPTVQAILEKFKPDKSILSSVIEHNPEIENLLKEKTSFHKLNHLSKIPITTPVGKPSSIGADRLALVVAAADLFPGKNNLVIGLGSAVTYNFINKYNEFLGGGISPGMEMRFIGISHWWDMIPAQIF